MKQRAQSIEDDWQRGGRGLGHDWQGGGGGLGDEDDLDILRDHKKIQREIKGGGERWVGFKEKGEGGRRLEWGERMGEEMVKKIKVNTTRRNIGNGVVGDLLGG